ncbi:pimeloyl-ACP methyl ester carboxylesterase [Bradyrhizobium ottawaense]|uniref:Pimeloyl-ACP methyl ester carboxylesterase n=2 Tax=Nitrobacteraceae TaxID=41294 RepID=A0ABV4FVA4_9BRAD|nr:alpha/beta hydrolase [Bradyrhizobium ottawaense]PDT67722.1 alpha/beta hydrolase [Bradyrhizobium ottawaense]BBO07807.1 alpha/beta hydrolase [Bradyrhizobium ottawaense]GMO42501.1 alpha/beta hydrolase [Bradyrhizobium ottawaense]GMO46436.1 alpha/beta hydrolase [Bradyrhizobium ottawaense]
MIANPDALPLAGPAPVSVRTSRGTVQCAIAGEGPAIMAIHGGMGGHDQSWLLARALAATLRDKRVVAVSRPGYLGSRLELGASPDDQADVYGALLDALGISTVAVVAVSAGGPSALQFAARHPSRCRSLVLVSACTGKLQTPPEITARLRMMRHLARLPGLPRILKWRSERNPQAAARRAIPDDAMRERTLRHPEAGPLFRALQSTVFEHLHARLPGTVNDIAQFAALGELPEGSISAPALIVHGRADNVVPFSHAENVCRAIPQAKLLALPDGGHVALFTHLNVVRKEAEPFLDAHERASLHPHRIEDPHEDDIAQT